MKRQSAPTNIIHTCFWSQSITCFHSMAVFNQVDEISQFSDGSTLLCSSAYDKQIVFQYKIQWELSYKYIIKSLVLKSIQNTSNNSNICNNAVFAMNEVHISKDPRLRQWMCFPKRSTCHRFKQVF